MSRDRREEILVRLLAIGGEFDPENVRQAFRNKDEIGERDRPCVRLFDGDEAESDQSAQAQHRGGLRPTVMVMLPVMSIELGGTPEAVGTDLNSRRLKLIGAVKRDAALASIVGANGAVHYRGLVTSFSPGRRVEAVMNLQFAIAYPLIASEL